MHRTYSCSTIQGQEYGRWLTDAGGVFDLLTRDARRSTAGCGITIEVLDLPVGEYERRVMDPDGMEHVERFANATDLPKRQGAIQDRSSRGWAHSASWVS
jgi:hypothetical protein